MRQFANAAKSGQAYLEAHTDNRQEPSPKPSKPISSTEVRWLRLVLLYLQLRKR